MGRRDGPHEMEKKNPKRTDDGGPVVAIFVVVQCRAAIFSLSRRPTKRATEAGHLGLVAFTAFLHFFLRFRPVGLDFFCWIVNWVWVRKELARFSFSFVGCMVRLG